MNLAVSHFKARISKVDMLLPQLDLWHPPGSRRATQACGPRQRTNTVINFLSHRKGVGQEQEREETSKGWVSLFPVTFIASFAIQRDRPKGRGC